MAFRIFPGKGRVCLSAGILPDRFKKQRLVISISCSFSCSRVIGDELFGKRVIADNYQHMRNGTGSGEVRIFQRLPEGRHEHHPPFLDFRFYIFQRYILPGLDIFVFEILSKNFLHIRSIGVSAVSEGFVFEGDYV